MKKPSVLLACLLLLPLAALVEVPAAPPNLILIMPDDQGYGEIGAYGNLVLRTPNLDRLHAESVRFTDFHVSPTCAPTRAALLTGRHEFHGGVTHTIAERERLDLGAVTLAEVLSSAGYATGIFGKWHLGDEPAYHPARRGFQKTVIHGGGGIGQTHPGSCGDAPDNTYHDPWVLKDGRWVKSAGYCTDVFFDAALEWVDERRGKRRPFFAMITPNAPHDPFVNPGPKWEEPYRGRGLTMNEVAYYAMIANIDANVGRLLDRLDSWQLATNTLVIFLTDNGHSVPRLYNAGMRGIKGGPYQGGTRVPSFWRWPGRLAPGDRPQLAAHLDVFPTLAELAGARVPAAVREGLEGRSLVPLLFDPRAAWPDRRLFIHLGRWPRGQAAVSQWSQTAVRTQRYRLVNGHELHDLTADPGEQVNVADRHPEIVSGLRAAHDAWWASVQSGLVNEAALPPRVNPLKALFWKQHGGGPDARLAAAMDPWSEASRREFDPLVPHDAPPPFRQQQ
ncbi:MAG: arylsulfatase [Limisphaerales bacterium]